MPKGPGDFSNGIVAHISLYRDNNPVFGDMNRIFGISEVGEHFMAGVYHGLNPLTHLLAPSFNSLKRLQPGQQCGVYKYWSIDNKEAPLSLVEPIRFTDPTIAFSVRLMDSSTNIYLAFASLIVFGMNGLNNGLALP
mmetsp:Transcript_23275/g.22857  ORF Transcript_23275/g.22857 Transcript_23275/m.22857 type:complete len:137 (+) Transcript_23275:682-1092(+)